MAIESHLQPLSGETFRLALTNSMYALGYWNTRLECLPGCFLRSKGYSTPISLATTPKLCLPCIYKKHEDEKKRVYGQRVLEIKHGMFTPLVLSTSGGMGIEKHKLLTNAWLTCSLKCHISYSSLMVWLRCKLSFAILRSTVMCIRGSRSSRHRAVHDSSDIALVCSEGCVPQEY